MKIVVSGDLNINQFMNSQSRGRFQTLVQVNILDLCRTNPGK